MAFVRYEKVPVKVGYNTANKQLYATSFTVTENLPLTPVRSIGYNGAVSASATGPMDGTWSISWIPAAGAMAADSCDRDGGNFSGVEFIEAPQKLFTADPIFFEAAGKTIFEEGAATSFSLSIEPNNLITCTMDGNFYDPGGLNQSSLANGADDEHGAAAVAHGSTSGPTKAQVAPVGFSTAPFSVSYTASRGLTPIFTLHKLDAAFIMPTDPQESMTMQGDNLPKGTLFWGAAGFELCLEPVLLAFPVKSVCGTEIFSEDDLNVCGYVQSRDVAIATDDIVRGNITVIDYNYPQQGGGGGAD